MAFAKNYILCLKHHNEIMLLVDIYLSTIPLQSIKLMETTIAIYYALEHQGNCLV